MKLWLPIVLTILLISACDEKKHGAIVKGHVFDYFTNEPLEAITVIIAEDIDGDSIWGTITNVKGEFNITIPDSQAYDYLHLHFRDRTNHYTHVFNKDKSEFVNPFMKMGEVNEFDLWMKTSPSLKTDTVN